MCKLDHLLMCNKSLTRPLMALNLESRGHNSFATLNRSGFHDVPLCGDLEDITQVNQMIPTAKMKTPLINSRCYAPVSTHRAGPAGDEDCNWIHVHKFAGHTAKKLSSPPHRVSLEHPQCSAQIRRVRFHLSGCIHRSSSSCRERGDWLRKGACQHSVQRCRICPR